MSVQFKIGFGYDVHRFAENRKLIIGGIEVPHTKGLAGHSDADVLLHSVCDAVLGALALGDIGHHFPNSDPKYKGIDSKNLLGEVYYLMREKHFEIGNIDATVLLEQPKLEPFIPKMKSEIAKILNTYEDQISIKATTSEGLGFAGREEGCAAYSVVLLTKKDK